MYSILIIDDEPIVKIALRSILPWEEHGFFICGTASNGLEAVPLIEKHHPDIIITDLKMPEMDGLELIRFLKEKEYPGEILVLSNYEDFDSVKYSWPKRFHSESGHHRTRNRSSSLLFSGRRVSRFVH